MQCELGCYHLNSESIVVERLHDGRGPPSAASIRNEISSTRAFRELKA